MRVVRITPDNVYRLVPVFSAWLAETKIEIPVNKETGIKQLMQWIDDDNYAVFALDEDDPSPTYKGVIVGHAHGYTFTDQPGISEIAWYVHPDARGHGLKLLNALQKWGEARGATYIISHILLSSGKDRGERAMSALQKLGFTEFERTFIRFFDATS